MYAVPPGMARPAQLNVTFYSSCMDIAFVLNHTSTLKSQAFELGLTSSHNMLSLDLLLREAVLRILIRIRIRIHRIHMFLGLLDTDPDPLVTGMDLLLSKNSKKNLDFYYFVTSIGLFILEKNYINVPSKSNMQKNFF